MCISLPGKVLERNGALALVRINARELWCNALAQPEVTVGDYVQVHANLIVAVVSEEEAEEMFQAALELDEALERERSANQNAAGAAGRRRKS